MNGLSHFKTSSVGITLAIMIILVSLTTSVNPQDYGGDPLPDPVIEPLVEIQPSDGASWYVNNGTLYLDDLIVNNSVARFTGIATLNRTAWNVDTGEQLCGNTINCSLSATDDLINVLFTPLGFDVNLSFGPPGTSVFRWIGCSPNWENTSATPENQTGTYGIDLLCNNGTVAGDVQVKISGVPNTGWTIYASNESTTTNLIELTTSWQTIYNPLKSSRSGGSVCGYAWFVANCSFVTQNPGVYEEYQIIGGS